MRAARLDRTFHPPAVMPEQILALALAAADVADSVGESAMASYLRELADVWSGNIERCLPQITQSRAMPRDRIKQWRFKLRVD